MSIAQTNYQRLSLRLPKATIKLIDQAARIKGSSRTEFIRGASLRVAEMLVLDRTMIAVSANEFKSFIDEIETTTGGDSSTIKC